MAIRLMVIVMVAITRRPIAPPTITAATAQLSMAAYRLDYGGYRPALYGGYRVAPRVAIHSSTLALTNSLIGVARAPRLQVGWRDWVTSGAAVPERRG